MNGITISVFYEQVLQGRNILWEQVQNHELGLECVWWQV